MKGLANTTPFGITTFCSSILHQAHLEILGSLSNLPLLQRLMELFRKQVNFNFFQGAKKTLPKQCL